MLILDKNWFSWNSPISSLRQVLQLIRRSKIVCGVDIVIEVSLVFCRLQKVRPERLGCHILSLFFQNHLWPPIDVKVILFLKYPFLHFLKSLGGSSNGTDSIWWLSACPITRLLRSLESLAQYNHVHLFALEVAMKGLFVSLFAPRP